MNTFPSILETALTDYVHYLESSGHKAAAQCLAAVANQELARLKQAAQRSQVPPVPEKADTSSALDAGGDNAQG